MKLTNISIIFILTIFFIGCSSSTNNLTNSKEYQKILREKKEFVEKINPMATVNINKNSLKTITLLQEASNNILYVIKLENIRNIQSILLTENKKINIEKVLFKSQDFFYDKNNEELLINLNIPYLYLVDNTIEFDMFFIYETTNKEIKTYKRKFIFKYKPMEDSREDFMSFVYMENMHKDANKLDPIIKKHLELELQIIDKNRLSKEYLKKIEKIENNL